MRIVLYTHPAFFEPALSLVAALASSAEVHLVLEVNDRNQRIASFEASSVAFPPGLMAADPMLAPLYAPTVRDMWRLAATFTLVSHGGLRSRDPRSVRITGQLLRWVRDLNPDVLHVDDVDVSPRLALGLALTRSPCPLLLGCHDPDPHSGARHWWRKSLARTLAFPRADAVLVHHESGRKALLDRHRSLRANVFVVRLASYNFLAHLAPAEHAAVSDAGPVVLFFGRISPYKGIELLFRAAPLVAHAIPQVRFLVAGEPVGGFTPPAAPPLPGAATIETNYDYIANTEIASFFGRATVSVLPYTDASQSGVLLTSYGFGCPVVATAVGGIPEYVEEGVTGLLVPPGDHAALAAALIRCLQDRDLLSRMRDGVAHATRTDLSWQRVRSELLDVYAGLGEAPGRRRVGRRNR